MVAALVGIQNTQTQMQTQTQTQGCHVPLLTEENAGSLGALGPSSQSRHVVGGDAKTSNRRPGSTHFDGPTASARLFR
jgi:hypothetical protein